MPPTVAPELVLTRSCSPRMDLPVAAELSWELTPSKAVIMDCFILASMSDMAPSASRASVSSVMEMVIGT